MGKKKKSDKPKERDKSKMKPADIYEDLALYCKKFGKEVGFLGGNPLVEMFEDGVEEKKDDFPKQIIISTTVEPILMKALMRAILEVEFEGIKSLRLWNTGMGDLGTQFVMEGLCRIPYIEKVDIRDSELTHEGAMQVGKYLQKVSSAKIRVLNLDLNTKLGGPAALGMKHLASSLNYNSTLVNLSLNHCGIGPEGGQYIGKMLGNLETSLKYLSLEGNPLRNGGVQGMSNGLGLNRSLERLNIKNIEFTGDTDTIMALSVGLKGCKTLCDINMDGNLIGNDGLRLLLENLHDCKHILMLDVTPFVDTELINLLGEWLKKNVPAKTKGKKKKGSKGKKKKKKK